MLTCHFTLLPGQVYRFTTPGSVLAVMRGLGTKQFFIAEGEGGAFYVMQRREYGGYELLLRGGGHAVLLPDFCHDDKLELRLYPGRMAPLEPVTKPDRRLLLC